ncbi:MAG TPA: hypothetical protein VL084_15030 [Thermoanaerobaculia bacterium]|nr:hypothetical protein [Thermoanaerobaculia bacterium]
MPLGVLLLAAVLAARTPTPTPTAAGYAVVQKDGSVVRFEKAPALKGTAWVGKLWPSGQLVSIPAASVDDKKTASANSGGHGGTPPTETNIGTRYKSAGPQAPLGDKVKLKGGRRTVERTLQGTPTPAKSPAAGAPGAVGGGEPVSGAVDRNGHGESWWRGKAAPVTEELADADAELKLASDERVRFEKATPLPGVDRGTELQRLKDREERARGRVNAANRRLAELGEEARKAGAPPNWAH